MNNLIEILDSATLNPEHGWTLETKLVAEGYGVQPETIRTHKADHNDELLPGRHWVAGPRNRTLWTRAGVLRLGMFIHSPQAMTFRDAAEQYLLDQLDFGVGNPTSSTNAPLPGSLDLLAAAVADEVLAQQLQARVAYYVTQKSEDRQTLEATLGKLQLPIPRDWPPLNAA